MGLFDQYSMNPYGTLQTPVQRPIVPNPPQITINSPRNLEKVNGIESVKQYPMSPNSMVALFDMNDDIFYIKQTDASNYPTIRIFRFYEESQQTSAPQTDNNYITVEEFNTFKEEMIHGQQSIWNAIDAATSPAEKTKSRGNKTDV